MASAVTQLKDIIHAIAARALRHDLKTPLSHVQAYCGQITYTFRQRPELIRERLASPSDIVENTTDIPILARDIISALEQLETTLSRSKYQTGADTQAILQELIDGKCTDLELKAASLKSLLEPDQQCSEYATRLLRNAKAARSRLRSLRSFFKSEYATQTRILVNLRDQAERAARDTSPNSATFGSVFSFSGQAQIYGAEILLQTLFQNIYENTLRYGAKSGNLRSMTSFRGGSFADLCQEFTAIVERPAANGQWTRVDLENNGPPLSAQEPNYIFQIGKRFDVEGIIDEEGQGLGMSICFAVATLHRGFIWAHSRTAGVRFSLLVPCRVEDGLNDAQLLAIAKRMKLT